MMRLKFCTFALVLGLSPIAMFAPSAVAQDRDRDDRNGNRQEGVWRQNQNSDLQNALHQRVPNSNIAVNWQNNNTVVLTGTAATERDRQYADQLVRSQVGNARVIDQVTVNGYNSAYPNGYPNNGTYSNGYPNNGTYSNSDRDRDRDNRTDADRDRSRTDADRNRTDNDRDDQVRRSDNDRDDQVRRSDNDDQKVSDRDHDRNHKDKDRKNKKDKDKNKDKDDRGDHDSDNRPH